MLQKALYLLKIYLLTVLIFVAGKPFFMLYNSAEHPFSVSDVANVVGHGLSLDLSTSLYFLIVPFFCTVAAIFVRNPKSLCLVLKIYFAIISLAFSLAFVADASLYEFWKFKLDSSCLQYLETPTEAMASVSVSYILVRIVIVALLTIVFYVAYTCLRWSFFPSNHRVVELLAALLLVPCMVIGIRGGFDESTTNIGQVYYSQDQFLNHSAVNPMFSFLASFSRSASEIVTYHFMDDAECERIIRELYDTKTVDSDTLLTTRQPNVIVILMESCGGVFTELGGRMDVMPHLNQLAKEGIYFTNCYGNTWRTDRGTVCTYSGYPSFPTMSVMKMPSKSRSLPNIARTLQQQRGYETYYLYGGDINFTNMRSYLVSGGFQTLRWMKDYSSKEQTTAQWGVRDDITFQTLFDMASAAQSPFLIGFSTLSSHEPWDVPIKKFDDKHLNAFHYLDQCIGSFIKQLRESNLWRETLVVLLPDHGIIYQGIDETHRLKNHIPMIWTGGAVKAPRRIEQVCNQTDFAATLLGQLGINHDEYTFSRDVLSKTYTKPFAVNTHTGGFSVYDSASFVNYDLLTHRVVAEQGKKNPNLLKRVKAVLQAASKDLNER